MRFATELMFKEDHSTEYSVKIQEVLNKIKETDAPAFPLAERLD